MGYIEETVTFFRDTYRTEDFIPLHEPCFTGNEKKYVTDTIDSSFVSSVGAFVNRVEEEMQRITTAKRAVAVVNGTAALQVALRVAGVKNGDEVITQALTFVATANAISYNNAQPVFLDVDLDTMGLSPTAVEQFLIEHAEFRNNECFNKRTGRRISACVPMHTFGFPARIKELSRLCDKWHIPLVEDAAESLGSEVENKPTGSFGMAGVFSFNGNKIITAGGGGIIVTSNNTLGEQAKYLTTTAKKPHSYEYFHDELGYNYRMPNLNAALACAQLEKLNEFLSKKRELADHYENFFAPHGLTLRKEMPGTRANYWLMCLELENIKERDLFLKHTNERAVMTRPIWQLMFRLPMYQDCLRDEQINAKFLEERIVNIPSSIKL